VGVTVGLAVGFAVGIAVGADVGLDVAFSDRKVADLAAIVSPAGSAVRLQLEGASVFRNRQVLFWGECPVDNQDMIGTDRGTACKT
jgi:hypothetical protein